MTGFTDADGDGIATLTLLSHSHSQAELNCHLVAHFHYLLNKINIHTLQLTPLKVSKPRISEIKEIRSNSDDIMTTLTNVKQCKMTLIYTVQHKLVSGNWPVHWSQWALEAAPCSPHHSLRSPTSYLVAHPTHTHTHEKTQTKCIIAMQSFSLIVASSFFASWCSSLFLFVFSIKYMYL